MKKVRLLVVICSCILLILPTFISPKQLQTTDSFHDVAVVADSKYIIVSDDGCIITSDLKEDTWNIQRCRNNPWLKAIQFVDEKNGYIAGSSGAVLKTTDGGKIWRPLPTFMDINFHACLFKNDSCGLVAGCDGHIQQTTNGGKKWTRVFMRPGRTIYGLGYLNDTTLAAVGQSGLALKSIDGGLHWAVIDLAAEAQVVNFYGVKSLKKTTIIHGANGTLLRSNDGGQKWQKVLFNPNMDIRDICLTDSATIIAVGDSGRIVASVDGGVNWTSRSFTPHATLYRIVKAGSDKYIAVGSSGAKVYFSIKHVDQKDGRFVDFNLHEIDYSESKPNKSDLFQQAFKFFLGKTYVLDPLGEGPCEVIDPDPRFDWERMDCTTAVEQSLGLASTKSLDRYGEIMDKIRYRGGRVSFFNRNHFFVSDWIPANSWLVEDITTNIDQTEAISMKRTIGRQKFFAAKNISIPQISDQPNYETFVIPSASVEKIVARIQEPMIIVFIGTLDWLFARHTGMVFRDSETKELILRHASSGAGKVVDQPFLAYIKNSRNVVGIKLLAISK